MSVGSSSNGGGGFGPIIKWKSTIREYIMYGKLMEAQQLVADLTSEQRKAVAGQRQEYDGRTLLCLAIENEQVPFMTFLLDDCFADVNQYSDPYRMLTPLHHAVLSSDMEMVRILVERGADVNAAYLYQSTPAFFASGKTLELVKYLVHHGADINPPNIDGETCLMRSTIAGNSSDSICQFLVELGASVNAVDKLGNSALHYAISSHYQSQSIVCLLLQNGADTSIRNQFGNDVLQTAALYGSTDMLDYLISQLKPTQQRQADLYSLMAAMKLDWLEDVDRAMSLWMKSLSIRTQMSQTIPVAEPNPVYSGAVEAQDVQSLEAIFDDEDARYMQALLCRERILGRDHIETVYWLADRAFRYAELPNTYQRGIDLYKYALASCGNDVISFEPSTRLHPHLLFYELLLTKYGQDETSVRFEDVADVMRMAILACKCASRTYRHASDSKKTALVLSIHVIHLLCRLTSSEEESESLKQLARELVLTTCETRRGETLLHVAVDQASAHLNAHYYPHMPSSDVVEQLLSAGADVNAVDLAGFTPLLEAVTNLEYLQRRDDWLRTVDLLLHHSAHVDVRNVYGEVAVDRLPSTINKPKYMRLECLAARAIRGHGVEYHNILPPSLTRFVDLH